ncbi:MAG: GNAT family N-acetyltransferase [Myxococcota bacterium]|nr:GNAT family N-acetyltransferase [Myxococcota bacterium]
MSNKLNIRPYEPGDETQIVELFREVFETDTPIEHWRWKYNENPAHASNIISLAFDSNQKLIGHFAGQAHFLNVNGKTKKLINCVDGFVAPEHKNSFVFAAVNKAFREQLSQTAIKLSLTVAGDESLKYIMMLGTNLGQLERYVIDFENSYDVTNFNSILASQQKGQDKLELKTSAHYLDEFGSIWKTMASKEILSYRRDADYLKWRYDSNPSEQYEYLYLVRNNKVVAFLVLKKAKQQCFICDIQSMFKSTDLAQILLCEAVKALRDDYRLVKFISMDQYYSRQIFRNVRTANTFDNHVFALSNDTETKSLFENDKNWSILLSDHDMI